MGWVKLVGIEWVLSPEISLIRFKESKYEEYKEKLDENSRRISASVQKCPDRYFRTTLQQLVQLMKRSRDVYFCDKDNNRNKPASIILTCIAANSYNGEQDLFLALQNVARSIKEGASINPITDNNEKKWEFLNPVDKEENYTRLWHENNNALYNAYNEWGKWFVENIERLSIDDNKEYYSVLKILFGEYPTSEILVEQGNNMRLLRESGSLKYGKNGFNTEEGEKVKNHNFYGK